MPFESFSSSTHERHDGGIPESMFEQIISEIESSSFSKDKKSEAIKKLEELQNDKEFIASLRARINTIEATLSSKPEEREAAYGNLAASTAKNLFEK
ncbi:MAG: hypothetical protein HYT28_00885 [Parcubacteria group bacterium]|nr:hypothetical protein [Parcubacteria group bacterium]